MSHWHHRSPDEVLEQLETTRKGLSEEEAKRRFARGNQSKERSGRNDLISTTKQVRYSVVRPDTNRTDTG